MNMNTMELIIAFLIILGSGLILTGIIICIFVPEQMGGKINWGKRKISSLALGLPLILVGIPIFLFSLEPAYSYWLRVHYLKQAKDYFWSHKRYVISGGKNKTDKIVVDDDLLLVLNDDQILLKDEDGWRSDFEWARYKGDPIVFYSANAKKLRIVVQDTKCCSYYLSSLYLHKPDGTVMKLTDGVKEEEYSQPLDQQRIFFDKTYDLNQ